MNRRRSHILANIALLVMVLACLAPIIYMILLSFLTQASFISTQSLFAALRSGLTFENFDTAFGRTQFGQRMLISLRLTGLVILVVTVIGLPAAHAIARLPRNTSTQTAFAFISVRMLPSIAVCIPIFWIFNRSGLVPTWMSLSFVQIGLNLPVLIWLAVPVFRSVPVQLEELVVIDGLSRAWTFFCVILPLVSRRLIGIILIIGILVWNESFFASIFRVDTVTEVIPSLITHRGVQWGLVMAVGTMVTIPALLLLIGLLSWRWGLEPEEM